MGYRSLAAAVVLGALVLTPPALADTTDSSNWAGYAIQRPGVSFRTVQAVWTQPTPFCRPGSETYSSYWVGLGGFSAGSTALEQIGTEIDCTRSGRAASTAWYETVPDPSFPVFRTVRPGDRLAATVTVRGRLVTLVLRNLTRGWSFHRTLRTSPIDVSSAEWIVEAPSECQGNWCRTLPLANFGSAAFTSATATTSGGHTGSLSDPSWRLTEIRLRPGSHHFAVAGQLAGGATPSPLGPGGSSFGVNYSLVSLQLPGTARDTWVRGAPGARLGSAWRPPPSHLIQ